MILWPHYVNMPDFLSSPAFYDVFGVGPGVNTKMFGNLILNLGLLINGNLMRGGAN